MTWRGYELTDPPMGDDPTLPREHPNWHAIELLRRALHDKCQWARDAGVTYGNVYDRVTAKAVYQFKIRTSMALVHDEVSTLAGIANLATRSRLGSYPPPAPPRHACLTFRGTGGIIGLDYTSRIAQACPVDEIPIATPATMGPVPVGAATDPRAPSGQECVDLAVEMACQWIESTTRSFVLAGYSLGAIAASQVRAMLEPGQRLAKHKDRYVCGVTLGNPSRRFGHTFYLGGIPGGEGISDFHLPEACCTWDWCDLAQNGDLYTNVPLGDIGDVCRQAYKLIMDLQINDPLKLISEFVKNMLGLLDEAGADVPAGIITGALSGLLASVIPGMVPLGNAEAAAAAQAAVLGIRFAAAQPPTEPHISYEWHDAIPGKTYLDLGIQHVTYWCGQKAVAA